VYDSEPFQDNYERFMPVVWLSDTRKKWETETATYLEKIRDRLALTPDIRELAKQETKGITNQTDVVHTLARFVQRTLTYKAIEFGPRGHIPTPATEILRQKYGDCKDHSLLLHQLLGARGVESHLALLHTDTLFRRELPTVDQFNHMILYIPGYKGGRFIDATGKGADLDLPVPYGLDDRDAMILDAAHPRFIHIPLYAPKSSLIDTDRHVQPLPNGDAVAQERLRFTGYYAAHLRNQITAINPSNRQQHIQDQMNANGVTSQLDDLKITGLDDPRQPLELSLRYRLPKLFRVEPDQRLIAHLPGLWERNYLSMSLLSERTTPVNIRFPLVIRGKVRCDVPDGYKQTSPLPAPQQVQKKCASLRLLSRPSKHRLEYEFEIERPSGRYPATDYASLQQTISDYLRMLEPPVTFTPAAAPTPIK
jgi:hypothetical protein